MVRCIESFWLVLIEEKPVEPLINSCLKIGIEGFFYKWIL